MLINLTANLLGLQTRPNWNSTSMSRLYVTVFVRIHVMYMKCSYELFPGDGPSGFRGDEMRTGRREHNTLISTTTCCAQRDELCHAKFDARLTFLIFPKCQPVQWRFDPRTERQTVSDAFVRFPVTSFRSYGRRSLSSAKDHTLHSWERIRVFAVSYQEGPELGQRIIRRRW